jgi:hypothetical protein
VNVQPSFHKPLGEILGLVRELNGPLMMILGQFEQLVFQGLIQFLQFLVSLDKSTQRNTYVAIVKPF